MRPRVFRLSHGHRLVIFVSSYFLQLLTAVKQLGAHYKSQ